MKTNDLLMKRELFYKNFIIEKKNKVIIFMLIFESGLHIYNGEIFMSVNYTFFLQNDYFFLLNSNSKLKLLCS